MSMDCCKCGIFEKIFPVNLAQNLCLLVFDREKSVIRIFPSIRCFRPGSNWGSCACKAHVMTTTLRKPAWRKMFGDVVVLRGRKLLDRSCKIAVSFHFILKYLNADQLKNFFVVSVSSSPLTMNLAFSPSLNLELNRVQQLSSLLLR